MEQQNMYGHGFDQKLSAAVVFNLSSLMVDFLHVIPLQLGYCIDSIFNSSMVSVEYRSLLYT